MRKRLLSAIADKAAECRAAERSAARIVLQDADRAMPRVPIAEKI
jgi:hypothetical protein